MVSAKSNIFTGRCQTRFGLIPILILLCRLSFGQGLCDKTGVEVGGFHFKNTNFTTVCNIPYELQLEDASGGTDIKYVFDYQGETDVSKLNGQSAPGFTYNQRGVYTILQYGRKNGREMYACEKFEVWESKSPVIDYFICDNKTVNIVIVNSPENKFNDFFVLWGDANENLTGINDDKVELKHIFSSIQNSQNINVYAYRKRKNVFGSEAYAAGCTQIVSLNLDMNEGLPKPTISEIRAHNDNSVEIKIEHRIQTVSYQINKQTTTGEQAAGTTDAKEIKLTNVDLSAANCYKVSYALPACNATVSSDNPVCTVPVSIQENPNENKITFSTSWLPLKIIRQDINGADTRNINAGAPMFVDEVKCGANFCYAGIVEKDNVKVYTEQKCTGRVPVVPLPPELCLATVKENNRIEIRVLDQTIQKTYDLLRQNKTGTFELLETSPANSFTDIAVDAGAESYCYQIRYKDHCDNQSEPSDIFCSVLLKRGLNNLEWSAEEPFTKAVSAYELKKLDKRGNLLETIVFDPTQQDYQLPDGDDDYNYRLVIKGGQNMVSESNLVSVKAENGIFIPSAFTPNLDGRNEDLAVFGNNVSSFRLIAYNKWGEPVFETDEIGKTWNGGWKNDLSNPLPIGQYSVLIKATFKNGDSIEKKEVVTLLR